MKVCNNCKRRLGLDKFHKDRTHRDGHKASCKDCRNMTGPKIVIQQARVPTDPMTIAKMQATKQLIQTHQREFRRLTMEGYHRITRERAQAS